MSRSIFIGDVHGCADELERLLDAVGVSDEDGVFLVGDLVARGPASRRVLQIVRERGAQATLGNHEERLLDARAAHAAGEPGPRLGRTHEALLETLDDADWALLESLPRTLEVPEHGVLVVHAGVVPGVALAEQDPWLLTHLRSIEKDGTPSSRFSPRYWGARWEGPPHVVFGHNAQAGLQLHKAATGLDTGCVYGKKLTALVLDAGASVPGPKKRKACLHAVAAKRPYYVPS